ncbi:hypothetical protein HMPREF9237_01559 [Actinotignum schaalii FB123-CNA-2]|uniref:DUF4352 domain-containing protein n=1 Tax=Actinotignum schaalii FB123-CNA-2 TaxID=883067 RepID=S2VJW2_9ACTO|nr:hypothetical protein HMPREF9237_01559 [Actinotignum schaalii FB123-CNA-2]
MMHSSHTTQAALSQPAPSFGRGTRVSRWTVGSVLAGLSLAGIMALGGCASTAVGDPDPVTPIPVASAAPGGGAVSGNGTGTTQERAAVTDGSEGGRPVTVAPSGDVEAELGVPVGLSVDGATRAAFTLTVTDITRAQECPSRIAEPAVFTPKNGTFLVVDLSAQMAADYAAYDPDAPFLTLDRDAFHLTDRDGNIQEDSHTVPSYGCYSTAERVTPFINPGESAAGKVVLETSLEHGYLVYNPWGVPGSGWRWAF